MLVVAVWILMLAGQYIVSCMVNLLQYMVELILDIVKFLTTIVIVSYVLTPQPTVEYETMLNDVKGVDLARTEVLNILQYLRDPKASSSVN